MMLNLQFAETMELTEAELQEVSGGNTVVNPGNGGGLYRFGEAEVLDQALTELLIG